MSGMVLKTAGLGLAMAGLAVVTTNVVSNRERLVSRPAAPAAMSLSAPAPAPAPASGFSLVIPGNAAGHFEVQPAIDGTRIAMMVDTGASVVALAEEDAFRAGIRPFPADYTVKVSTANGVALAAPVTLREVTLGDIYVRDVKALVMPRGRLNGSLLGMSFLSRLGGFQIENNRLYLRR